MKLQSTLPIAALLLGWTTIAAAAHGHGMESDDMRCEMMGHAKMAAGERKEMMDKMFAKLDIDRNGAISRAEFDKYHEQMQPRMEDKGKPEAHDHDHDEARK
jgi:hypothetical protein